MLNVHVGQLERTMFEKYCKGQRLRALIKQDGTIHTEAGRAICEAFKASFDRRRSGTLLTDILAFSASMGDDRKEGDRSKLSPEEFGLVSSWYKERGFDITRISKRASRLDSFTRLGARFTTQEKHRGDSQIIVGSSVPDDWDAARLVGIIVHDGLATETQRRTFLLVKRYKRPVQIDREHDHYRKYSLAGGRLYYDEQKRMELVTDQNLLGHFARTPQVSTKIAKRHFHSLPLDKVRFLHILIRHWF